MANVRIFHKKVNMWPATIEVLKERHKKLNEDARSYGIHKSIPFTKFLHAIATKGKIDLNVEEIRKLSGRTRLF